MRRVMAFLLGALALVVLLPILATLLACRSFLYHPTRDVPAPLSGWTAVRLDRGDAIALSGLVRTSSRAPFLLFFGGNAATLSGNRMIIDLIDLPGELGAAIYAYRGYDGSGGEPTEELLKLDAEAIVASLPVAPSELIVLGQSLGSGVASHVAHVLSQRGTPPRGLILFSPYTSIAQVFDDQLPLIPIGWAVTDPWRTDKIAPDIECPVLIIHGVQDRLISIKHGRELAERFGPTATLVEIESAGHNDLFSSQKTLEAISSFLTRGSRSEQPRTPRSP